VWNEICTIYVIMKYSLFLSALFLIFLSSCGTEIKKNYIINDVKLFAEGPLFDGPNTLQANYSLDLASVDPALVQENIKSVKLVKAQISTSDSLGFDRIRSLVFQATSADVGLQQLAVINPIPKELKTAILTPSSIADMKELFRQKQITLILDADLEGDLEENLEYLGNFEFEIVYNQK